MEVSGVLLKTILGMVLVHALTVLHRINSWENRGQTLRVFHHSNPAFSANIVPGSEAEQ